MAAVFSTVGCATSSVNNDAVNIAAPNVPTVIGKAQLGELVTVKPSKQLNDTTIIVTSQYTAASGRLCRRLQSSDGSSLPRVVCKDESGNWVWARNLLSKSSQSQSNQLMRARSKTQLINVPVEMQSVEQVQTEQPPAVQPPAVQTQAEKIDLGDIMVSSDSPLLNPQNENVSLNTGAAVSVLTDNVAHTVLPNETLWSFAKRTTGNALNWQSIADVNGIDDARTIAGGDILQVPSEFSSDGA